MRHMDLPEPKLPFPLRTQQSPQGPVQVYEIPKEQKAAVLKMLYPFLPVPSLEDEMEDIHTEKTFRVRDFVVLWEAGMNVLASPYYLEGGGSVIDWLPVEDEDEFDEDEI
jgi:hypothetical protein